jgi:hypothetical protein
MLRATVFCVCATVLGCSVVDRGETTYSDHGAVCLRSTDSGGLEISVTFPVCLSSSCERAGETSCSLTRRDTELEIRSRGVVENVGARMCTSDCGSLQAFCESEPLEPGGYVVVHGSDSATVSLPQASLLLFADDGMEVDCEP